jgi:hypothetical protein
MISKRFGSLVVLCEAQSQKEFKNKARRWACLCDCGNETEVNGGALKSGHVKSCGCSRKDFSDEPVRRQMYSNYKCQASKKNREFTLTFEEFDALTKEGCFYCGARDSIVRKKRNSQYAGNGVDRKDNAKGYVIGNAVSCCRVCNHMKYSMTVEDFVAACRSVVSHFDSVK